MTNRSFYPNDYRQRDSKSLKEEVLKLKGSRNLPFLTRNHYTHSKHKNPTSTFDVLPEIDNKSKIFDPNNEFVLRLDNYRRDRFREILKYYRKKDKEQSLNPIHERNYFHLVNLEGCHNISNNNEWTQTKYIGRKKPINRRKSTFNIQLKSPPIKLKANIKHRQAHYISKESQYN